MVDGNACRHLFYTPAFNALMMCRRGIAGAVPGTGNIDQIAIQRVPSPRAFKFNPVTQPAVVFTERNYGGHSFTLHYELLGDPHSWQGHGTFSHRPPGNPELWSLKKLIQDCTIRIPYN